MVVVLCCVSVRKFPKPHKAHKSHRHCSLAPPRHLSKSWQFWWTWWHGWLCAHHMWWYFTPDADGVCIYDDRNPVRKTILAWYDVRGNQGGYWYLAVKRAALLEAQLPASLNDVTRTAVNRSNLNWIFKKIKKDDAVKPERWSCVVIILDRKVKKSKLARLAQPQNLSQRPCKDQW